MSKKTYRRLGSILIAIVLVAASQSTFAYGAKAGTKYVAHRGCTVKARENTAKAYVQAGKRHFWGAECDIYETKHAGGSFTLVLHHDDTFKRIYGKKKKVRSMTAAQMKKSFKDITFLEEYADICVKYNMHPVVEYKDEHMSDAAIRKSVDILSDKGLLEKAYFQSFYMGKLKKVRKYIRQKYKVEPAMIYLIRGSQSAVLRKVKSAHGAGINRVSIRKNRINKTIYNYCKKRKMKISAWTFYQTRGKRTYHSDRKLLKKLISKYHLEMAVVESGKNGF